MTTRSTAVDVSAPELPEGPRLPGIGFRLFGEASDYVRLSELVATCNEQDAIPWLPTADNLQTEMENSTAIDPTRDVLFAEVDGELVAATGVKRVVRDGIPVYDVWGNVLAELRRRGLGTALLDWTLDRIRQRAAIEDPGTDVVVQGGAEDQETGHRALLERARFEPVRHFFLMHRASLDDVPDAPLPDGVEVRPVTTDQHRAILDAEFEAFR
ncbi:MAG: GNAT family N-acetyltransferase, partial [Candidatus Limnocylindrales bacterium]|nr:GNAT family N-acetyltransferase [Candidatus Limnocylindrales bacterium]